MVRTPCCDKLDMKRGMWTAEEDAKILAYVSKHGTGNWTTIPRKAGLRRCGKSCRLRWTNYLRPDLKHDNFTPQEEELIIRLHAAIGSRWSIIAQQLPDRTDNDIKNYWNTKLRKKLSERGIDPVTHKPFSQILADYGNLGGLPKTTKRVSSISKDLKNAILVKSEPYNSFPTPQGFSNIHSHLMSPSLISPKSDSIHLSNLNINMGQYRNLPSLDLLSELQSIKMVTQASKSSKNESTIRSNNDVECLFWLSASPSSSSSSSSSICSTAAFSWKDFLLEEAILPCEEKEKERNKVHECVVEEFENQTRKLKLQAEIRNEKATEDQCERDEGIKRKNDAESSFMEAMMNVDNNLLLDFPGLLDEPFFY